MLLLANAPHKKVLETTKMIKIQYEHLCCMISIINLLGCCICFIGPPVLPLAISAFMTPVDAESEFDHALVGLKTDNRQHIAVIFVSIGPRLSTIITLQSVQPVCNFLCLKDCWGESQ